MRVMVTGGAGKVGRAVVARLVEKGYAPLVVDRQAGEPVAGADYRQCDVLDYAGLRACMRGCDAVVHLAAVPSPGLASNEALFNTNVSGTFNVFQAAAAEGIHRVVQASSINALGYFYGLRGWQLSYLPVDEEHPIETTDAYSLSKSMVEDLGRYFWRREGISSVSLRFPGVLPAFAHQHGWIAGMRAELHKMFEHLLSKQREERLAWFEERCKAFDELRATRIFEDPERQNQMWRQDSPVPMDLRMAIGGRYNLFAMIDERDAAQAVEKGLSANYEGSHPLFVNDRYQYTGIDTNILIDLLYPDVPALKRPLVGIESLVSNERARELIGFEPEYTFA